MVSPKTLQILHGVAGAAHLAQAATLAGLVGKNMNKYYKWPVTQIGWEKVLTERTLRINLGYLVPVFPFLSSVNHLVSAAFPTWYENDVLKTKVNYLRWIEYSVSATVMLICLCILSGVNEARSLASISIINVGMMMMGLLLEKRKAEGASRSELLSITAIGWTMFAAQWVQLITSFFTIIGAGKVKPPKVVYSIIGIEFALFASFGVLQILYALDVVTFENYEAGFIGLSLVSKTLLSWLLFGGVLSADGRFEEDGKPVKE